MVQYLTVCLDYCFFLTMIFAYFRIKEMGGSRKFGNLQTRNAVTHGTSGGCICDCLGALSGKVNIALTCGRVTTISRILFTFFENWQWFQVCIQLHS